MRTVTVEPKDAGARLDRWLGRACPGLGAPLAQKYIRLKRIKVNGMRAEGASRLNAGDVVEFYIGDEWFDAPKKADPLLGAFRHHLRVIYEDQHVLLVDKRPGMIVHPDASEKLNTLVTHARAYLYQKGEYDSTDAASFAPAPCNRIDRFTGGLVIVAKTREALDVINRAIRDGEIDKHYLCVVHGQPRPREGTLDGYIVKGDKKVSVTSRPAPGAQHALTHYRVLRTNGELSLVECRLVTGRTHQIRAQFAHAGSPLLGDNQYGDARKNARYARAQQALYAYKLTFAFAGDAGALAHLAGRTFRVPDVPFVRAYFPDVTLP